MMQIDTTFSLLGFALVINSSILILAAAAFYYGSGPTADADIAGAFKLVTQMIGQGAGIVFALALLCVSLSWSWPRLS
jgi:metal iron transporter